jgi:hypothetical protein
MMSRSPGQITSPWNPEVLAGRGGVESLQPGGEEDLFAYRLVLHHALESCLRSWAWWCGESPEGGERIYSRIAFFLFPDDLNYSRIALFPDDLSRVCF